MKKKWNRLQDAAEKYGVNRQTLHDRATKANIATKVSFPTVTKKIRVKTRYYDSDALDKLMANWAKRYSGDINGTHISKPD